MNQFISAGLTLLQYGGSVLLACIGAAILNNIVKNAVMAYFAGKAMYTKEVAQLAASHMAQRNGMPTMEEYMEAVRKMAESEVAGK